MTLSIIGNQRMVYYKSLSYVKTPQLIRDPMEEQPTFVLQDATRANLNARNGCYITDQELAARYHKKLVLAPLISAAYHLEVVNAVANITFTQKYENPLNKFLQMEYCFPVNPNICIYRFLAVFGNMRVEGVVKEKEEAKKQYIEAVKQGKKAAYGDLDSDREVLILKVGNVPPQQSVTIEISYLQELTLSFNTFYQLELKKVFSPRYMDLASGKKYQKRTNQDMQEENTIDFKVSLKSTKKVIFFSSPSHQLNLLAENDSKTELELGMAEPNLMSKDFIFQYTTEDFQLPSSVLGRTDAGSSVMLSFIPKFCNLSVGDAYKAAMEGKEYQTDISQAKGQYIFLLDRSGSMGGKRIKMAKQALTLFIKSLPQDSYFNVVSFGSSFQSLFEQSLYYNDKDVEEALQKISKMSANLGGTQIYNPLKYCLNLKINQGYPRHVFLLTDGYVFDAQCVIKLVAQNNKYARVHGIGISSQCSKQLIVECAAKGRGKYVFIDDHQEPSEKIIGLLTDSLSPVISKVQLNFDKEKVQSVIPNPESMPYILKDQIVNFYISFKGQLSSQTTFSFTYQDSLNKLPFASQIVISPEDPNSAFVDKIGHFKKIRLLEDALQNHHNVEEQMYCLVKPADKKSIIIKESVQHQILSEYTAFVCIQKELVDGRYQQVQQTGQIKLQLKERMSQQIQEWGKQQSLQYGFVNQSSVYLKRTYNASPTYGASRGGSRGRGSGRFYEQDRSRSRSPRQRIKKANRRDNDRSRSSSRYRNQKKQKKRRSRELNNPTPPIQRAYTVLQCCSPGYTKKQVSMKAQGEMSINQIVNLQSTNGSWKDVSVIGKIFGKEVEQMVSKQADPTVVITYLVVKWIQKHHPQRMYNLVVKKGIKYVENQAESWSKIVQTYEKYI